MTRQHNTTIHCPSCGVTITHESAFGRWIRANPALDSRSGYSVMDQDYWIHRFKTHAGREFQLLMMVEIKTRNSEMTKAQSDTAWIIDQVTRNRKQTPTSIPRKQSGSAPYKVRSQMAGRDVYIRTYGVHQLRFSGIGPGDSEEIWWDKHLITLDQLTALIRFDLDPDSLKPLDLRSHHRQPEQGVLLELVANDASIHGA